MSERKFELKIREDDSDVAYLSLPQNKRGQNTDIANIDLWNLIQS